jgi:type IV secretory pathway TraG/TraD family ATPase VirD4
MQSVAFIASLRAWQPWWLLGLPLVLLARLVRSARAQTRHKRGAQVLTGRAMRRSVRRRRHAQLRLAGVGISTAEETRHFKLIGTTGSGKSTAIAALLSPALARGDRAVITDPDGGYRERFYQRRRGDILLNPFDPAGLQWDPFAEVGSPWDVELLASALIPATDDASGREWRGYARTFLSAVMRRCWRTRQGNTAELYRLLTVAGTAELRALVAGSPAQPFLDAENLRMFASIRSVAGSAAAALEYVQAQRARTFAVREWVRSGSGVLFMPYSAAQIAALRSIIGGWMRLAIFECLSQRQQQRIWFVVDELDALGAIDGLKDALARLRKFGGVCVLGFQSIAQVSSTYGHGDAQVLVENCGNSLILRCSGSEHGGTSQFAARLIGEREVVRPQHTRTRERSGLSGRRAQRSSSISEQQVTEPAVLPSELEQLPDLAGFLKTAASPHWLRVNFHG